MDINKYRRAYHNQKAHAAQRGIEFLLTFQEWCDFWGEDIERRGNGPNDLQMQRHADTGPYTIGIIRKGTPKQNAVTAWNMRRKRECEMSAEELQIALDAMMNEPDRLDHDDDGRESHYFHMGIKSSYRHRYFHVG
jgi:hypothetical protein